GKMGFAEDDSRREQNKKEKLVEELKKHYNPEFLNRIDEIVTFHTLTRENIYEIIDIMVKRMNDHLFEKRIKLELDDSARELITKLGYDEKYGARPLRRVLQREIEDHMSQRLLEGAFKEPTILHVSAETMDDQTKLKYAEASWVDYETVKEEKRVETERKEAARKEAERNRIRSRSVLASEPVPPKPDLIPGQA
ncbi:MAG TPA: ATP-dependent Clp protease ATP-binding subunit, partial [Leptospiraceae bacterium]|nr:ATP-dependent Clp protease ATP-binding subunit [Leptospiraceae bacterium]